MEAYEIRSTREHHHLGRFGTDRPPSFEGAGQRRPRAHALSRHARHESSAGRAAVRLGSAKGEPPADGLRDADAVIHLAGAPVAQRWSAQVKQDIRESRVAGTRNLVQATGEAGAQAAGADLRLGGRLLRFARRRECWLNRPLPAATILAEVCVGMGEGGARRRSLGMRVVRVRPASSLDARGGALQKMLPPFKMGAGGKLGDGRHWMSWIHLDDLAGLYQFALANRSAGRSTGSAPNPVTNADFTRALAAAVHRPPFFRFRDSR